MAPDSGYRLIVMTEQRVTAKVALDALNASMIAQPNYSNFLTASRALVEK
jgi:hypothetical protein